MKRFADIVQRLHRQLENQGIGLEVIAGSFKHCGSEERLKVLTDLFGTFSYWSAVYRQNDDELADLHHYRIPECIINFYREFEPGNIPCLSDGVGLLNLEGIKMENSSFAPGAYLIRFGLITFATTTGGNAICMDLNELTEGEPRIVYADHTWFMFDEDVRQLKYNFYPHKVQEPKGYVNLGMIKKYLPEISKTFSEFLDLLSRNNDWDPEEYYDLVGNRL
jgi:hypothetical protein